MSSLRGKKKKKGRLVTELVKVALLFLCVVCDAFGIPRFVVKPVIFL